MLADIIITEKPMHYYLLPGQLLGLAVGQEPIKFILSEFVSYLGRREVLCVGNS